MLPELVDSVIDQLHDDHKSLRACTLVQKQWLPRSSHHLFSRMRWPPCKHQWPEDPADFSEGCKCHLLDSMDGLGSLHTMLLAIPRMTSAVRQLRITMAWDSPLGQELDEALGSLALPVQRSTSPYELSRIIDLIPHLDRLEILSLQFVPMIITPPPRQAERRLRALRIVAPPQPVAGNRYMPQFFSCFSKITSLSLDKLSSPVTDDMPAPSTRPEATHLRLTFQHPECCSDWFNLVRANVSTSSTDGLVLGGLPTHGDQDDPASLAVNRLIRKCPGLSSLTYLGPLPPSLIYLSPCPTLRTLRLSYTMVYGVNGTVDRLPHWPSLATAMQGSFASSVKHLTLELTVSVVRGIADLEPDEVLLQRNARGAWNLLDWDAFGAFVGRLQSLTMDVRCQMFKQVRRSPELGLQQELQPWRGDQEVYRRTLELVIRGRVLVSPDQKLEVVVSFPTLAS